MLEVSPTHRSQNPSSFLFAYLVFEAISRFFGGGGGDDQDDWQRVAKGDDVIVDLDATLEDLYMGGSLKVHFFLLIYFEVFNQ